MDKKYDVVVVGLGYIGLPTATVLSNQNINVYGVDVSPKVIRALYDKKTHIVEPGLEDLIVNGIDSGYFEFGTSPKVSSVYMVVVPTPFKENNLPDISYIYHAFDSIIPFLKEGDLCIIESTSPVGTTELMAGYTENKRPELKGKLHFAYCPERVLPGNIIHELIANDRVIGGVTEESTLKAIQFYEQFVKGTLHKTNARTAEMCKLVENASRDAQIAFANELSMICDKANINVWELIALANKHPRVNILNPGSGVGGHCIAVDPYFIATQYPLESKIINTAREVNNYKAYWCIEKITNAILQFEKDHHRKPNVGLFGLAFKPNIDDLRESPAKFITATILEKFSKEYLFIVEPNLNEHDVFNLSSVEKTVQCADIIVLLVAHQEFYDITFKAHQQVLDFCGVTNTFK